MSDAITVERLLRVPRLFGSNEHQRKYEANRARHVAETGELVEAVATLAGGGHSSLCFCPFENGKGSYACTCGPDKYIKARAIISIVQGIQKDVQA